MPQMSKVPFLLVSLFLLSFFVVWMVKVWFSSSESLENKNGFMLSSFGYFMFN